MTELTGKRALLDQLVADGVRYIFGNPGTTEQAFMDALQDVPELEFVLCLHEGAAIGMADAYARATGKPAFVQLHIAPGLGNGIGMLFNAMASHSPLVVYVGQSATDALFQEPLLSGDLVGMARSVTKWAYEIGHAADVPQALRRAMKVAEEAPRGPVLLSIPIDVMDATAEVDIEPTTYTRWRVHPDPAAIDEAAAMLAGAERPLVIVGDGVSLADGQAEVASLAELLGAPIYHGYSSEINVASDHPLLAGTLPRTSYHAADVASRLLAEHDVVVVAGAPLFRFAFPRPGRIVPIGTKVIQIDVDGWQLGKNVAGVLPIKADVRAAVAAIIERLGNRALAGAQQRRDAISAAAAARRSRELEADRSGWDDRPMPAGRLMHELAAALPPDVAIFDEAISSSAALTRYVTPVAGRYFRARGGGIGPGVPGAVGLKLAIPDRPVVGVVSDGSAMYNITAIWTAAHHRIPVVWVVCNNGTYQILKQNVLEYLGDAAVGRAFVAMDLDDPPLRFDRIAEAFGAHGRRVEDPADVGPAIKEALALGGPAVVDVAIAGLRRSP